MDRPPAENIIDRPDIVPANPDTLLREPDNLYLALLEQEATIEYYLQRNRMIYRQGGSLHKDEEDKEKIIPLDAEGEEQGKKASRFMAARLGRKQAVASGSSMMV